MSKRNVSFIKPEEPSFLKKLKRDIGYKEGPTVETKRENLSEFNDDDEDGLDDQPVVVVLKKGDLTAEEVENEKKRLEAEADSQAADLNQRIIFRPSAKNNFTDEREKIENPSNGNLVKNISGLKNKLLSFNEDEEDEEC